MITKGDIQELTRRTSTCLIDKQLEMQSATYQVGEANTDTDISAIACRCCKEAWEQMRIDNPTAYNKIELTTSVPDILLSFTFPNGEIQEHKIELKTCKNETLPGSTLGKLDVNQFLIYILRTPGQFDVRWSSYRQAMVMDNLDSFNDRTPRPGLSFSNMNTVEETTVQSTYVEYGKDWWISHYANAAVARINAGKQTWQEKVISNIRNQFRDQFIKDTSVEEFARLKSELSKAH